MKCEICGSEDIVKEDDLFVCKGCGCKYTLEQAKKLAGTTAATDTAEEKPNVIDNLYTLARRALDAGEYAMAESYYLQILPSNPNDWEAAFYSVFAGAMALGGRSLTSAIKNLRYGHAPAYDLIATAFTDDNERSEALNEVVESLALFTKVYYDYGRKFFREMGGFEDRKIFVSQAANMIGMMNDCGDTIQSKFQGEAFNAPAVKAWKRAIELVNALCAEMPGLDFENAKKVRTDAVQKIRNVDPTYTAPQQTTNSTKSGGCYVATCVYGSYDCAEVWTLRRYRDDTLAATRRGRAFIRMYYAVSPTVVKLFGKTKWFHRVWKKRLDKKVAKLQAQGVECTPYQDKEW